MTGLKLEWTGGGSNPGLVLPSKRRLRSCLSIWFSASRTPKGVRLPFQPSRFEFHSSLLRLGDQAILMAVRFRLIRRLSSALRTGQARHCLRSHAKGTNFFDNYHCSQIFTRPSDQPRIATIFSNSQSIPIPAQVKMLNVPPTRSSDTLYYDQKQFGLFRLVAMSSIQQIRFSPERTG